MPPEIGCDRFENPSGLLDFRRCSVAWGRKRLPRSGVGSSASKNSPCITLGGGCTCFLANLFQSASFGGFWGIQSSFYITQFKLQRDVLTGFAHFFPRDRSKLLCHTGDREGQHQKRAKTQTLRSLEKNGACQMFPWHMMMMIHSSY